MSKKFEIDLYSQLELNNVAFRRDGRIEAQCALDEGFSEAPAENGMLLAVDKANGLIKLPVDGSLPIALNYTTEHMYDERKMGLKNFCLRPEDGFYPRMGYLWVIFLPQTACATMKAILLVRASLKKLLASLVRLLFMVVLMRLVVSAFLRLSPLMALCLRPLSFILCPMASLA